MPNYFAIYADFKNMTNETYDGKRLNDAKLNDPKCFEATMSFFKDSILKNGVARIAYSYDQACDLNLDDNDPSIQGDIRKDRKKSQLFHQKKGEIQIGDYLIYRHLPKKDYYTVVKITGDYYFDLPTAYSDFGHCRPCELILSIKGETNVEINKPNPIPYRQAFNRLDKSQLTEIRNHYNI